jgi:hypothetical protein
VKKRRDIPPYDSWITIKPGESFTLNAKQKTEWDRLKQVMREYRGNILANSFQTEMQLDRLLCEVLFPASDDPNIKPDETIPLTKASAKSLRNLFDEFVLKAGTMPTISFGYKIELLGNLADEIPALGSVVPKSLIKTLNNLRRIRNNFAHYPVTFIPNGSTSDQNLDIVLATHKAEYKIDNEYVARTDAIFKEADQGLKDANEAMRKNLNRDQDVTRSVGSAEVPPPKLPEPC